MSSVTRRVATAVTLGVALAGAAAAPSLAASRSASGLDGVTGQALSRTGGLLAAASALPSRLEQIGANLSGGVAQGEMGFMQNMGTHMMQGMGGRH